MKIIKSDRNSSRGDERHWIPLAKMMGGCIPPIPPAVDAPELGHPVHTEIPANLRMYARAAWPTAMKFGMLTDAGKRTFFCGVSHAPVPGGGAAGRNAPKFVGPLCTLGPVTVILLSSCCKLIIGDCSALIELWNEETICTATFVTFWSINFNNP